MTRAHLRSRLAAGGNAITSLLDATQPGEERYSPAPDRWSLVEIVNHLADEEANDFRARLRSVVEDPGRDWSFFNPSSGVEDGSYASRDFGESVARWRRERAASLAWLDGLEEIDPAVRYAGARADEAGVCAGDLMSSWIAHDYFHLRQIARLRWDYLASDESPWSPGYAGEE